MLAIAGFQTCNPLPVIHVAASGSTQKFDIFNLHQLVKDVPVFFVAIKLKTNTK
jgi:hypothetical protein